jgi:CelD/BcsL family acetyltransferase involved in cellulose biosynthesis
VDLRREVIDDLASVEAACAEWRDLAARCARSPLQSPDWLLPLARRYLAADQPRVLTWRDGGRLVGIAPLGLMADRPRFRPLRELYFWGTTGPRMRGLVDVVAEDSASEAVLDDLADWLRRDAGSWDVLRILRPPFGSTTPARLRTAAGAAGWSYAPYSTLRSTTYQLDLPDSADGWQRHLSSKTRKVMRWEVRKFGDFRGGRFEPVVEAVDLPEALAAVERLLTDRWAETEVYFSGDPGFSGLVNEAVPRMAENGAAWVSVARDDEGIHGVLVSLAQNGHAMALMVAVTTDPAYRPFSLGKHLFDVGIREAVERGCRVYDFLWVGGYKESFWHAGPRDLESAFIGRGPVGRIAARGLVAREAGLRPRR